MADLFIMALSQVNTPEPPQGCTHCAKPEGYHKILIFAPQVMIGLPDDHQLWRDIAEAQERGEFTVHATAILCTDCLGEVLSKIHGPSSKGLPYMINEFGSLTIASLVWASNNNQRMGMARGIRSIEDMYGSIIQGRVIDLGGA